MSLPCACIMDQRRRHFMIGHVAHDGHRLRAKARRRCVHALFIDIRTHDFRAARHQRLRQRPADAGSRASHQRDLAFIVDHACPPRGLLVDEITRPFL
mgnify:CR=1 FL=1